MKFSRGHHRKITARRRTLALAVVAPALDHAVGGADGAVVIDPGADPRVGRRSRVPGNARRFARAHLLLVVSAEAVRVAVVLAQGARVNFPDTYALVRNIAVGVVKAAIAFTLTVGVA